MRYVIASDTDAGVKRHNNQDALYAASWQTGWGAAAFAVLCDGMGGLQYGEVASRSIVQAFAQWAERSIPELRGFPEDYWIRTEWTQIVQGQNQKLHALGAENSCLLGSTATVLLLTDARYYVMNIGDTRAYELGPQFRQLTEDHTVVAEEIRRGNLTPEQAEASPAKSVLTKCVGVYDKVYPDFFFGDTRPETLYLLCSDGFRHWITPEEMHRALLAEGPVNPESLGLGARELIRLNMERGETDNISVVAVYTGRGD